jgi:hypothetical protein
VHREGLDNELNIGLGWRLGGSVLAIQSETYNDGRLFVAPIPVLTYDLGAVRLNAIYVPRYGKYNQFAVFGFYFTLPLGR